MRNIVIAFISIILFACQPNQVIKSYQCVSCNLDCDTLVFKKDGICPHCRMSLIEKTEATVTNPITIHEGSGNFYIKGGIGNHTKLVRIFYHRPKGFHKNSPILMVIPGAGRNAYSYRDAWIKASEKHTALVVSPMYLEKEYDYGGYHFGGLFYNLNLHEAFKRIEGTNRILLDEKKLQYNLNKNPDTWLFNDFDRLFNLVIEATGSNQKHYDIFGHSAGGQLLHRFVMFQPQSKARKIIASNSGTYTLPNFNTDLPFGIKNTTITSASLKASFSKPLILLIGEHDDANGQGGTFLRSPTLDNQGLGRLERAHYFFKYSKKQADSLRTVFNWTFEIVPNTGHDQKHMVQAASKLLFE